jgi:hypothetical protein
MLLVADPVGVVTLIGPEAVPDGTVVTTRVAVAEITAAGRPLNVTAFSPGVSLKPAPWIVTDAPTGALFGVNSIIETTEELRRSIESRFPTKSYV